MGVGDDDDENSKSGSEFALKNENFFAYRVLFSFFYSGLFLLKRVLERMLGQVASRKSHLILFFVFVVGEFHARANFKTLSFSSHLQNSGQKREGRGRGGKVNLHKAHPAILFFLFFWETEGFGFAGIFGSTATAAATSVVTNVGKEK